MLRAAHRDPRPYWQRLRFRLVYSLLYRSGDDRGHRQCRLFCFLMGNQRNMAAIFVNLAGMRDCISGYRFFVPSERAQQMQHHYLLYRAAYNCSQAATINYEQEIPEAFALQPRLCNGCLRSKQDPVETATENAHVSWHWHPKSNPAPFPAPRAEADPRRAYLSKNVIPAILIPRLEHLVYDQIVVTSPLRTSTYGDEDLAPCLHSPLPVRSKSMLGHAQVGRIKMLGCLCHPTGLGLQVLYRYSAYIGARWQRKLLERDW